MDSEKTSLRIKQLREGLKWIAGQGCEAAGEYASCSDLPSNPCITEYCLPCYAAAILMQDDRQPAVPETVGVKALASATCSAARVEKERSLLLWMQLLVGLIGYQPEFPHSHKQELADAMTRYEKALDAVEQQNDGTHAPATKNP